MAREERNREGNKQLRQRTREINQLLDENTRLALQLREAEENAEGMAGTISKLQGEKAEVSAGADENMRLVNDLERQISVKETTETALTQKIEELQVPDVDRTHQAWLPM